MKTLTARVCLVLFASLRTTAHASPDPTPRPPAVSLPDAVTVAEKWARDHGVDVSGQYVNSARLCWDDAPGKKCRYWHVQWTWTSPRLGGEFGARVYMDGAVVPQRCGP